MRGGIARTRGPDQLHVYTVTPGNRYVLKNTD